MQCGNFRIFLPLRFYVKSILFFQDDNGKQVQVQMRIVGEVRPGDWSYIQVFNILIRETFRQLNLKQLGRNYYDPSGATQCPQYKLEIWPGYITSIRNHEHDMLMCVDQGKLGPHSVEISGFFYHSYFT